MNSENEFSSKELTPQETGAILQRILAAIEKDERKRWVEISCAFVLSLATMSSAWCAYQSNRWSGVQTFRLAGAMKAGRESSAAHMVALQTQLFDASMFISYIQAKNEGNERQEEFLFNRFRPEMKKSVDAWLSTDPFNNPAAPQGPFKMGVYAQPELEEAKHLEELFAGEHALAQHANETSDTYVLLTVMFASVMFFGGIGGTFQSRRLRRTVFVIAVLLFAVTLTFLVTMPVCRE